MNQIETLQTEITNDHAAIAQAEINLGIQKKMVKLKERQLELLSSLEPKTPAPHVHA